ncbi:MAG: tripartite tricarboxylate transporter substrate-binding protein [Burkholderiaceae bacterium]
MPENLPRRFHSTTGGNDDFSTAGGRVRALAVSSTERVTAAPQLAAVPTVSESGYPGFDAATWTGLVAPAGTPTALIERLNSEVRKVLARDDVKDKLAQEGSSPLGGTPEAFGRFIRSEHDKWGSLIREANIKLD